MGISCYRMYNNRAVNIKDINNNYAARAYLINSTDLPVYDVGGSQACKVCQPLVGGIMIDNLDVSDSNNFTLSVWAKFKNIKESIRLHGHYAKNRIGFITSAIDSNYPQTYYTIPIPTTYDMSVWHHYRVSKSSSTITFYIDNVSIGSVTYTTGYFDTHSPYCYFVIGNVDLDDSYQPIFDEVVMANSVINTYNSTTYYSASTTLYDRTPTEYFESTPGEDFVSTESDTVVEDNIYNWRSHYVNNIIELTENEEWVHNNSSYKSEEDPYNTNPVKLSPNTIYYSPNENTYNITLSDVFLVGFYLSFEYEADFFYIRISTKWTNGNIRSSQKIQISDNTKKWITISRYDGILEYRMDGIPISYFKEDGVLNLSSADSYILIDSDDEDVVPSLSEVVVLTDAIPVELLLEKTDYYQSYTYNIQYNLFSYIPSELEEIIEDNTPILLLKIY